jgi:nucleotide-binding universal stress UspA family protein
MTEPSFEEFVNVPKNITLAHAFGHETAPEEAMLPFKKILFPVDFSEPCKEVVPYVKDMKRHFSAELALIHAYGPEALAYSPLPITDPHLPEQVRALTEQRLGEFAQCAFPGEHVELYSGLGEPGGIIRDVVQRQGADLVMMPTHGRGPLRRMLLGSATAKVLHDLTVPVWTSAAMGAPKLPCRVILCAVDDNEETETVVRAAAALATSFGAQLSLAYVLEMPPASMEMAFGPYKSDFINAADARLRELKGNLGLDAPHHILDGLVAEALHDEALNIKADLLVTGRGHVHGTFGRMWSHLYPIVRHAPCPVLSI